MKQYLRLSAWASLCGGGEACAALSVGGSLFPGDMSSRHFKPEIRATSLRFSPTGEPWASGHQGGRGGLGPEGLLGLSPCS